MITLSVEFFMFSRSDVLMEDPGVIWIVVIVIWSSVFFKWIVMDSLSVFMLEHVSIISNFISFRTRIATPPGISSLKLFLSQVSFRVRMSISFSYKKRDISTSLFLQLRIFIWANLSLEEFKDVGNKAIFYPDKEFTVSLAIVEILDPSCSMVLKSSF